MRTRCAAVDPAGRTAAGRRRRLDPTGPGGGTARRGAPDTAGTAARAAARNAASPWHSLKTGQNRPEDLTSHQV